MLKVRSNLNNLIRFHCKKYVFFHMPKCKKNDATNSWAMLNIQVHIRYRTSTYAKAIHQPRITYITQTICRT
jgi:hypothetical protein